MDVFTEIPELSGSVLTIGVFDGVHLGHQALLARLREHADRLNLPAGVITFDPYPDEYFSGRVGEALTLPEERHALIAANGIDFTVCLAFDEHLANLSASAFARLLQPLHPQAFVLGPDFVFGRGREGRSDTLARSLVPRPTIEHIAPEIVHRVPISSTLIRSLLKDGHVEKASRLLGRPYTISGKVVPGKGKGRLLGVPTINLAVHARKLLPKRGVYAAKAYFEGVRYPSGVFIDTSKDTRIVEAHLIGYSGQDLYEKVVTIELHSYLRAPREFQSDAELRDRILKDLDQVARIVGT
jgi:riboflavin kinase/FMN adenylyltransferase